MVFFRILTTCAHAVLIAPAETLIETGSIVAGKLALQIVE
jgi:hypothetical protein